MGITSVYYNVVLCLYFLVVVKLGWTERKFRNVRRWVHLGVLVVGLTMSLAIIPFVTPDWRWCYLNKPPFSESWLPGVFFFILPIGICMIAMTILMTFFVKYVRGVEGKSDKRKLSGNQPKRHSLARATFWQSFYFLAIFYTVWPIQFVAFLVPVVDSNYWVYLLAALFGPLQGFLNAMLVFSRDHKALSSYFLKRLQNIKERWSNMCGALFKSVTKNDSKATGKKSERSSCSGVDAKASPVSNGSAQPEIMHDPFRLQGEEKPSSANILVQGNADSLTGTGVLGSQHDFEGEHSPLQDCTLLDTCIGVDSVLLKDNNEPVQSDTCENDAILECAMNAGLLSDGEYVLYRDSIEFSQNAHLVDGG